MPSLIPSVKPDFSWCQQRVVTVSMMLSAPEVAEVLGISRAGAYELVSSAGFPHVKIANRILVPKDKFLKWIDAQTVTEGE